MQDPRWVNDRTGHGHVQTEHRGSTTTGWARALLATWAGLAVSRADLRDPVAVLDDPVLHGVIDLAQPVCVILAAVAHFLPVAQAAGITAEFTRPLAAGSWLAISVAHFTDEELLARYEN